MTLKEAAQRVGGTGSLACEGEVINMSGSWGGYNANPNHRCRYKAKYLRILQGEEMYLCGVHAATSRRWAKRMTGSQPMAIYVELPR